MLGLQNGFVAYGNLNTVASFRIDFHTSVGTINKELPLSSYQELLECRKSLRFGLLFEQRLDMLLENYVALEKFILDLTLVNVVFAGDSFTRLRDSKHHANRHLNNLFSTARLYIDQTDHALSEHYGKNSSQRTRYLQVKSSIYDESYAYRVMESLRNYVQHKGLLAHSVTFTSSREEEPGEDCRHRHSVRFGFSTDVLGEDKKFKRSVLREMEQRSDRNKQIEILPLAREYVSKLAEVHKVTRHSISAEIDSADNYTARIFNKIKEETGRESSHARVWAITPEEERSCQSLSPAWINERKSYVEKNFLAEYISRRYVTSW